MQNHSAYGTDILDEPQGQHEFNEGVELYNSGYYFEAHDAFEEIWMDARGRDRVFLQSLVQLATGTYHLSMKNFKGARSQLMKCKAKLKNFAPEYRSFKINELIHIIEELIGKIPKDNDKAFSFSELNSYIPVLQKIKKDKS